MQFQKIPAHELSSGNYTFSMFKPEACPRAIGVILGMIHAHGMEIFAMKAVVPTREFVEQHYAEHKDASFFPVLVNDIADQQVYALILEGAGVRQRWRDLQGGFLPEDRKPGTVREMLMSADSPYNRNFTHGTKLNEEVPTEIRHWFPEYVEE